MVNGVTESHCLGVQILRKGSMMLHGWSWSLPGNNGQFPASPTDTKVTKSCDWKPCSWPQCSRTQVPFMSWMPIHTQLPFLSSFPSSHFSPPKSLQLIHFNLSSWVLNASSPVFAIIFSAPFFSQFSAATRTIHYYVILLMSLPAVDPIFSGSRTLRAGLISF